MFAKKGFFFLNINFYFVLDSNEWKNNLNWKKKIIQLNVFFSLKVIPYDIIGVIKEMCINCFCVSTCFTSCNASKIADITYIWVILFHAFIVRVNRAAKNLVFARNSPLVLINKYQAMAHKLNIVSLYPTLSSSHPFLNS